MESLRTIREKNLVELVKVVGDDAIILQRISHRLHQLDENACNYGLTERQLKRVERLEIQAGVIGEKHDLVSYHQRDPRGWSLYLVNPNQLDGYNIDAVYYSGIAVCPH